MKAGDVLPCIGARGYNFTTGKLYTIVQYEPPVPDLNYTWPAYVQVEDDTGKLVLCHASRFEPLP